MNIELLSTVNLCENFEGNPFVKYLFNSKNVKQTFYTLACIGRGIVKKVISYKNLKEYF